MTPPSLRRHEGQALSREVIFCLLCGSSQTAGSCRRKGKGVKRISEKPDCAKAQTHSGDGNKSAAAKMNGEVIPVIFETERLALREMKQTDLQDLAEILQNPKVMYAYEHDFSDNDVQAWLDRQIGRYKKYGFGLWAAVLKSTNEMIGQAGLTMQPYKNTEVLEIGYLLKENFWHCGYAREAAMGCKKYAFENLKRDKVYSVIKADNLASVKVAESIGMRREDAFITQYDNGDMLHFLYSVPKSLPAY